VNISFNFFIRLPTKVYIPCTERNPVRDGKVTRDTSQVEMFMLKLRGA